MPTTDKPAITVNFRKLLLNRCQKEFEKDKVDDVVFERKQKELDSAATVPEKPNVIKKRRETFLQALVKMFMCIPPDDRARASSGRARGSQGQSQAPFHRQHQVHRGTLQAQDVDRGDHARLCGQAAEEPRRGVFGVSVPAAHHHWKGPGF